MPISTASRGKAIICPQVLIDGGHANAGDHDFHCVNFTPSVNLIVDVKAPSGNEVVDDVLQSFYRGKNMRVVLNYYLSSFLKIIAYTFVAYLYFAFAGTANVTLKDSIFQASSPLRHMVELAPVLKKQYATDDLAAVFMFTDGGPDHNCKHLSVQAALLGLFLLGGMDTMVVLRTAPQQSWTKRNVFTKYGATRLRIVTDRDGQGL